MLLTRVGENMKKTFAALSLALSALFFVGCSCSSATILSFNELWGGDLDNYTETFVYDVNSTVDYNEHGHTYTISEELKDLTFSITGTYAVENKIINKTSSDIPSEVKSSELFSKNTANLIRTKTALNLSATYTLNNKTENSLDTITTEAYYYNVSSAFAPIYVKREFKYSNPSVNSSSLKLNEYAGSDVTLYSENTYSIKQTAGENTVEKEYEYTYKSVIDNASLFLALRNKTLEKDGTYNIPVVVPAYGSAQNILISRYIATEKTVNLKLNGEDKEIKFNVRGISFLVNSVNGSGTSQIVFVQDEKVEGLANKSIIVSHVEPLVEYSGFRRLGALIYTLKEASIN